MAELKTFPRIWDDQGERTIIGETKISWIVVRRGDEKASWVPHIDALRQDPESGIGWVDYASLRRGYHIDLVNKKTPNDNDSYPRWWFQEQAMKDDTYHHYHLYSIADAIRNDSWSRKISADVLRQIADLIGYDEDTKKLKETTK